MELHTACRLRPPSIAPHCLAYLDRLSLAPEVRAHIEASLEGSDQLPPGEAMERLHLALAQSQPHSQLQPVSMQPAALASAQARLPEAGSDGEQARRKLAPRTNRGSMAPHPWGILNPFKRWAHNLAQRSAAPASSKPAKHDTAAHRDVVDGPDPQGQWRQRGNIRRIILLTLMLVQTAVATYFMAKVLPYQGGKPLEIVTLVLFAILFCWVSAGFWTALAGFLVMLRGGDRFAVSRDTAQEGPIDAAARTAIVMPICNEDVGRVIAGLRATYESIAATGELAQFDFFILSDSSDPDICTAELAAWAQLCQEFDGFGRIFYRRRQRRVKRKSGNIDDFCRRWGKDYRYMIVLDADSVMSGNCVTTLVRMMEAHPGAGIIQTAPRAAGRETLYARIQQFATAVYGPLFTAGLHYWQLGESHYWGHNAIIRMQPFVKHCALAPLPGSGSLAGEILSHDFVEAALMRRAGWGVWIAYDLDGSFEEMPPNLLDELKRDRRWCHGNLMNFRLFTAPGMHAVHRAVFVTGVMAYLSAPLWFAFLALSTVLLAMHTLIEPQYFVEPRQLFPIWPQWHPAKALALFTATATLLFLPKLLGAILICVHGAQQFGGRFKVIVSTFLEMLFSMLLAPVRMLFHTQFVLAAFLGIGLRWKSPPRHDSQTTWGEALAKHGWQAILGMAWCGFVYWLNPSFLLWLLPIAGALVLSVPVSVFSSRVSLGRGSKRAKLFMIPEESAPPKELVATYAAANAAPRMPDFIDAVAHPVVNALVCASARLRGRPAAARAAQLGLVRTALRSGPMALSAQDKDRLLRDPLLLSQLHHEVWSEADIHPAWLAAVSPANSQPAA